jgi:phosphate-selective porin OprO/OprP
VPGTTGWSSAIAAALLFATAPAAAQQTESAAEPMGDHTGANVHLTDHNRRYFVPDFAPNRPPTPEEAAKKAEKFFTVRPSFAFIGDWTRFDQNAASVRQVGVQDDEFQVRSARLNFIGTLGTDYKVGFQVGGEYKGFDTAPETEWQLTDLALTFPLGGRTKLAVGKIKETFSYEMVGDAANLPQFERVLNPFFVSRNMGARLTHVFGADKRATVSAGAYNDGWDINSKTSRGWDLTARATGLVWDEPAAKRFLHLGLAYRHVASDGVLRYRGRAETNVGDNFIDTGNITADGADHFGLEGLLNIGSLSLLGEYVVANVSTPAAKDPRLHGYYFTASWVPTGETRPYDRNVGYARRVIPKGYWGAPELVARFAHVDLDDEQAAGGTYDRLSFGLNWWATTRWKFGVLYGFTWLDRFNERGESQTLLTRVQWVY